MIKTLRYFLKNPHRAFVRFGDHKLFFWMSDKTYLKIAYFLETGRKLNLKNPELYSEKIQWVKLYDRKPQYIHFVDKIAVRETIRNLIGEEYLVPLIATYNSIDEIDWDSLPDKFVLKCAHTSQDNVICYDKKSLDFDKARSILQRGMKRNLFWLGREWAYKKVPHRITCEHFISDTDITPDDYKVICFNGKPHFIELHSDRYIRHSVDLFDLEWNYLPDNLTGFPPRNRDSEKPPILDEMLRLSETLAKDTYLSRIDWYYVGGKLYFGEITLYESSGFMTCRNPKVDIEFGSRITLPTK